MPHKLPPYIDTFMMVAGNELAVRCEYDYQPAEDDTNTASCATATSVYRYSNSGVLELLPTMSPDEIEILEEKLLFELTQQMADQAELA